MRPGSSLGLFLACVTPKAEAVRAGLDHADEGGPLGAFQQEATDQADDAGRRTPEAQNRIVGGTRRAVVGGIVAALAPRSLVAQAQQHDGTRRLGVLSVFLEDDPVGRTAEAALVEGLTAHNWHEGSTLRIDWRRGGGDSTLHNRHGAELVALNSNVPLAVGSQPLAAYAAPN